MGFVKFCSFLSKVLIFVDCICRMELILEEKDARDWTYRGEGAVNLVLAYSGSSPAFVCYNPLKITALSVIACHFN